MTTAVGSELTSSVIENLTITGNQSFREVKGHALEVPAGEARCSMGNSKMLLVLGHRHGRRMLIPSPSIHSHCIWVWTPSP